MLVRWRTAHANSPQGAADEERAIDGRFPWRRRPPRSQRPSLSSAEEPSGALHAAGGDSSAQENGGSRFRRTADYSGIGPELAANRGTGPQWVTKADVKGRLPATPARRLSPPVTAPAGGRLPRRLRAVQPAPAPSRAAATCRSRRAVRDPWSAAQVQTQSRRMAESGHTAPEFVPGRGRAGGMSPQTRPRRLRASGLRRHQRLHQVTCPRLR